MKDPPICRKGLGTRNDGTVKCLTQFAMPFMLKPYHWIEAEGLQDLEGIRFRMIPSGIGT